MGIAGSPFVWKKAYAEMAVKRHAVLIVPAVGVAPEVKAHARLKNGYAVVKWVYENDVKLRINLGRLCIQGKCAGAHTALGVCRLLAIRNESHLIKFLFLDVPAIYNDFM